MFSFITFFFKHFHTVDKSLLEMYFSHGKSHRICMTCIVCRKKFKNKFDLPCEKDISSNDLSTVWKCLKKCLQKKSLLRIPIFFLFLIFFYGICLYRTDTHRKISNTADYKLLNGQSVWTPLSHLSVIFLLHKQNIRQEKYHDTTLRAKE